jgi:hypothetical protein
MEDKSIQIQDQKMSQKQISSLLKKAKKGVSKKSSNQKKLKGKKKLLDISNQILQNLNYENFETETEIFYPQIFRNESKISINNVSLLDQSHFRFLVKQNADIFNHYSSYKRNDFHNIIWNDIELIYFYCSDNYSCPICLESKLCCPVISKCGHVFCFPCIVSMFNYHMNYSNNQKIPNCPLCSMKITNNTESTEISIDNDGDFKLCQIIKTINYNNNMRIKFNLILREKKSPSLYNLIYDPLLDNWKNNFKNKMKVIPDRQTKEFNFSRIFYENKALINKRLNDYKKDLNILKEEFDSTSDELRKNSIQESINKINLLISKNNNEDGDDYNSKNNSMNSKKINKSNDNNKFDNEDEDEDEVDINYKKYYLFYQEEKGDIYYLDPFIMEILLTEYGDYNSLPVELEGYIIDMKMVQVTPKLKHEYQYLNHLRVGSIIFFIEIDINDLISSSTKNIYIEKINERNRIRNLLKNQEKNYEEFINKKKVKIIEEEKNSSLEVSKKSLLNINGPLFFEAEEDLGNHKDNQSNHDDKKEEIIKKEHKLQLLFQDEEKEETKEKEEKKEKKEKEKEKNDKKLKNKKGGIKNEKKGGNKKGKKKKNKDIKEKVFNSEENEDFIDSDF